MWWWRRAGATPAVATGGPGEHRRAGSAGSLLLAAVAALALLPHAVRAQEAELAGFCASRAGVFEQSCLAAAQHLVSTTPRLALAAAGGNPVPGTASTLGMRLGSMPRWSVSLRGSAILGGDVPVLSQAGEEEGFNLATLGLIGALGVFDGFSVAPTVGGVLSVDALADLTVVHHSSGSGFESSNNLVWGAGLRLGILRESFTLPGLSLTGRYHHLGSARASGAGLGTGEAGAWDADITSLGLRAAASKSLLGFGLTAGAGLDRVSADGRLGTEAASVESMQPVNVTGTRLLLFGGASYTLLVLHLVAEAGWQAGGDGVPGAVGTSDGTDAAWYAALALRLSI